jgi:DNA-binding transcriptional LysR family regulator
MLDALTLDQLRIMIAVAETGSFSAAARRLARVQSAISQSVQTLEATLGLTLFDRAGKTPVLTDAGSALLRDANRLVGAADALRARAATIAGGLEPELSIAVDAVFPNAELLASLRQLSRVFPHLPVTVFTEGLGGSEQRLRDGVAHLGLYPPLLTMGTDLSMTFLTDVPMIPVVAPDHPLADEPEPVSRDVLAQHVQLVLTDRTSLTAGFSGNVLSAQIWRFADLGSRLDYLLAGFGWCYMPLHLVDAHVAAGRLRMLAVADDYGRDFAFAIHVVHLADRPPGPAGRWLVDDLRQRLGSPGAVGV